MKTNGELRARICSLEIQLDRSKREIEQQREEFLSKGAKATNMLCDADARIAELEQKLCDSLDAAIAAAIEPYRKDAERLDLLGKLCKETPLRPNAFCSEIAPDTRLKYEFPTLVSYDAIGQQISLRDAIDAAIAAKGESE